MRLASRSLRKEQIGRLFFLIAHCHSLSTFVAQRFCSFFKLFFLPHFLSFAILIVFLLLYAAIPPTNKQTNTRRLFLLKIAVQAMCRTADDY